LREFLHQAPGDTLEQIKKLLFQPELPIERFEIPKQWKRKTARRQPVSFFHIDGIIETGDMPAREFLNEFMEFIVSKGWKFDGTTREVDEGGAPK